MTSALENMAMHVGMTPQDWKDGYSQVVQEIGRKQERITQLEEALRETGEAYHRTHTDHSGEGIKIHACGDFNCQKVVARLAPQEEPTGLPEITPEKVQGMIDEVADAVRKSPIGEPTTCRCVQGMQGCPVHDTRRESTGEPLPGLAANEECWYGVCGGCTSCTKGEG